MLAGDTIRIKLLAGRPLQKLGVTLAEHSKPPRVTVQDLTQDGPVMHSGFVCKGDGILKINDMDVSGMSKAEVQSMIESVDEGTVLSVVLQVPNGSSSYLHTTFDSNGVPKTIRVNQQHSQINGTVVSGELDPNGPHSKNKSKPVHRKLHYLVDDSVTIDTLHKKAVKGTRCTDEVCSGSLMAMSPSRPDGLRPKQELLEQAQDFLDQYYSSIKRLNSDGHKKRWQEVVDSIQTTGTYDFTFAELTFACKTAWRNAARCIGRIQWSKLQIFDARNIVTARGMFDALCNHIKYATNNGNIRVDGKHDFRVWNSQFIKYAGYLEPDGTVLGDPASVQFTNVCLSMGWEPAQRTAFDVLPLVLQANGDDPELFELPAELVLEVPLKHPKYDWFEELGLKWFAVPGVSCLMLDAGGLEFTAIPFNGWYMGTEIGARDLCDPQRYNITERVGKLMGLETTNNSSLWKDVVVVEVDIAVIYSFQQARVTISDHHSTAESFMKFFKDEQKLRGGCPADWVWVVPPMSGSMCPVFHQEMYKYTLKPSYEYQENPWVTHVWKKDREHMNNGSSALRRKILFKDLARAIKFSAKMMARALANRVKCTILYATETGKAETYARRLCEIFKHAFDARVLGMASYDTVELEYETLLLVVTSTFGNGDPPDNGQSFAKAIFDMLPQHENNGQGGKQGLLKLESLDSVDKSSLPGTERYVDSLEQGTDKLANVRFSVFALGSRAYPHFCEFGHFVDNVLENLGAQRIEGLAEGDELCGQEQSFQSWAKSVFKAACSTFCVDHAQSDVLDKNDLSWAPGKFRLTPVKPSSLTLAQKLSKIHNKSVVECKLVSRHSLQSGDVSDRETILVKLSTRNIADLPYQPGDHVAVFPANRDHLVETVLQRLQNVTSPDDLLQLQMLTEKNSLTGAKEWVTDERLPPCSVREALTRYVDITTPPSRDLLLQLASFTSDQADSDRLELLANDMDLYDQWKFHSCANIADVLQEFPSLKVTATMLLTQLPKLQPRYYSISSSQAAEPDEIHATVAVVKYTTHGGEKVVHGVCSTWLNEAPIGESVPCFVRTANKFHLPEDKTVPVIMVGPGTGIAPFRGFWQQRRVDKEVLTTAPSNGQRTGWGPMTLYFGCRQATVDNLHSEETQQAVADGVLTQVHTALSRQPGQPKKYVQDLLLQHGADVYRQLVCEEGHFYVCGDVAMAADVTTTLVTILANYGSMTPAAAKQYIFKLKEQVRFHEDIFGITLRTSEVQNKKRDEAKKVWKQRSDASTESSN